MRQLLLILNIFLCINVIYGFLSVKDGHFSYNNEKVFLSGTNIAWDHYARDFGSGAYAGVKADFEKYLTGISGAGGNAIRVWVHIDGQWSPKFDASGHATGADTQSLIKELGELLDQAEKHNIFVILCLWNLAVKPTQMLHLYSDEAKLNSYIEKVLKPLATGLKNHKALGAYDIINEPMGSVKQNIDDPNPCYNTKNLLNSGADWTASHLTYQQVLKFINIHAAAIKSVDPKALITIGDGEMAETTICANCRNYYSDHCLTTAGGKPKGKLDFYQLHSYTWQGKYSEGSPFHKLAADYKSDKPIVVGEFSIDCSESKNGASIFKYIYNSGYAGALDWQYNEGGDCSDKQSAANTGMAAIRDMTTNGKVKVKIA